jgi:hypothetical protein
MLKNSVRKSPLQNGGRPGREQRAGLSENGKESLPSSLTRVLTINLPSNQISSVLELLTTGFLTLL